MSARLPVRLIRLLLASFGALLLIAPPARANDRQFAFTYESGVLPKGGRELEVWSTWRHRREGEFGKYFYSRFDHRLEFEIGLGHDVQTAFYINYKDVTAEEFDSTGASLGNVRETSFEGFSNEWKWKLMDPTADAVGLALYGEATFSSDEAELETKVILDKVLGRHTLAYNLVLAREWEFAPGETEAVTEIENDFAYAFKVTERFSAGAEVRTHYEHAEGETLHHALFAGPTVHYGAENWWLTFSWQKQLPAIKRSIDDPTRRYVLDEHEKDNIRLLWSWHF